MIGSPTLENVQISCGFFFEWFHIMAASEVSSVNFLGTSKKHKSLAGVTELGKKVYIILSEVLY